jgi:DNA-binding MarR family transcriptional regulator
MSTSAARADRKRFASPEQEAFLSLWRTYDRLRMLEDELFSRFELTAQQYNVLRILQAAKPGPLPTLVLAERLISKAPDITRIIDRLEQRGLVERQRDATNRRVVPIAITTAGSELLDEIAGPLRECHARQLGHLSKGDLSQLTALLRAARAPHETPDSPWG